MCSTRCTAPRQSNAFLELRRQGLGARRIARLTGVSVRTVSDWLAGRVPRSPVRGSRCSKCGQAGHRLGELDPDAYGYLLGIYLGDGYVAPHARGVFRLRVSLDPRYPGILDECEAAMRAMLPGVRCARQERRGPWGSWVEVGAYSKQWPCVLPQHGLGKKHLREIRLEPWQTDLLSGHESALLRGLVHSDGCWFINTGRGGWKHPRYAFNNLSDDIRQIFCWACDQVGVRWTTSANTVYVSRKADVARMDEFIGPKA